MAQSCPQRNEPGGRLVLLEVEAAGSCALIKMSRRLEVRLYATIGDCLKTSLQRLEESNMLKCFYKILEMRGSAGLYVTTKGMGLIES